MRTINVHEAKTHLSRILEEIAAGDEVILAKAGKPMAVLSPYRQKSKKRRFFQMEGSIEIADDFTETPADFRAAFE
jgi:prevent-host-death family protein